MQCCDAGLKPVLRCIRTRKFDEIPDLNLLPFFIAQPDLDCFAAAPDLPERNGLQFHLMQHEIISF